MRWKQFFTPAESMNTEESRQYLADKKSEDVTILDVRQPNEYAAGHIPGATLIPMPDLNTRINELDPTKPTLVY